MEALTRQRCLHHPGREAVARCPECGGFFCRECITEHDDRVICATCLRQLARTPEKRRARLGAVRTVVYCAVSVVAAWLFFYETGKALLLIPTSFHDGTLWQSEDQ